MKTFRTEFIDESQLVKSLFRQLFLLQVQLDWQDLEETKELSRTIDLLMGQLMDYYDPE